MRIGILTFHRAHNYGAVLQCFALQETLKCMGHEVEVIDYRQPWIEAFYRPFSFLFIRRRIHSIRSLIGYCRGYFRRRKRMSIKRQNFETFCKTHLHTSKKEYHSNYVGDYDAYIIGSDQLWSENCLGERFDQVYLGNFIHPNHSRVIGYAISINKSSLDDVCSYHLDQLKNFDLLSMREAFAVDRLTNLTHRQIFQTLDPTLLLDKDIWSPLINSKYANRKYVAIYQVRSPQGRQVLVDKAQKMAKTNGWEVIDLSEATHSVDDFVSILRYAQCIITSSFHATVFSVIFGTPFYSFLLKDGKDGRYEDLLRKLNLEEHLLDISATPVVPLKVNHDCLYAALANLRQSSFQYLEQIS